MSDIEPPKQVGSGYVGTWKGKKYWYDPDDSRGTDFYPYTEHKAAYDEQQRQIEEKYARSGWCFVATSAFENQNHPTVEALRQYRDEVLANNSLGQSLIKLYYSGLGNTAAKVLDKVPSMKPYVRAGLERLVVVIEPKLSKKK